MNLYSFTVSLTVSACDGLFSAWLLKCATHNPTEIVAPGVVQHVKYGGPDFSKLYNQTDLSRLLSKK